MKVQLAVASLVTFVAGSMATLTVNTPTNLVQCEPALITWEGGEEVNFTVLTFFIVTLISPGSIDSVDGKTHENYDIPSGSAYTWVVDIAAGTSIKLVLKDSTGVVSQSAVVAVQAGAGLCGTSHTYDPADGAGSALASIAI
ncbi:hypothetical protein CONPUDRAFT_77883 [Coniophora puteana RWD-64-598 SS2]|uniref:Uncharacterized protein n=1 Tax=Coniophora puteana (strain RWD-64-598) TaxID=741705 RepID=R7SEI7_CONPW|nr:uncharacterized protein CONPUDRAFT_77883 [Coniophora puteana RWD-64-598 SS2]EIW74596.1 hypothetical protein CONPUDRAFT_77883 [Coniophora puteana RWD-64-598 SS2]